MTDDLAKRLSNKIRMLRCVRNPSPEFAFYHHTADLIAEAVDEIERLEALWNNRPYSQGPFTGEIR